MAKQVKLSGDANVEKVNGFDRAKDPNSTYSRVKRLQRTAVASVAAAALGLTFGAYTSITSGAEVAKTKSQLVNVVVASQQIEAGSVIGADSLTIAEVPQAYVSAGATSDAESLIGKVANTRIDANTQVTSALATGDGNPASLSAAVDSGFKAVTIAVDEPAGMSGLIKVGDTVDVLGTSSQLNNGALTRITSSAKVIALGSSLGDSDGSYASITLQVAPDEADTIRTAQATGSVTFELHAKSDTQRGE